MHPLPLVLALFAVLAALVDVRSQPLAVVPRTATAQRFSAERASDVLAELLAEGVPHPVGSEANQRVRERIVARLTSLGLRPEVQTGWACSHWGGCAEVDNVVATLGPEDDPAGVLLTAHYDSVGAGPGAADDAAGVAAVLEAVRALGTDEGLRRRVVVLLSDGEEAGLLGAELFMREHPLATKIAEVVNLEARGTSGPSLMFETGADSGAHVALFAATAERPQSSSLYQAVYRALPNDTDFSVYQRRGLRGFNLGFIRGVARYHTPLDDLAHLDRDSLQHQGQNALALTRALARQAAPLPSRPDPVYFDAWGLGVVRWPAPWSVWLGVGALAALSVLSVVALRRAQRQGATALHAVVDYLRGWLAVTLVPAGAALLTWVFVSALRAVTGQSTPWYAHPSATVAGLSACALFSVVAAAFGVLRGVPLSTAYASVWTLLAVGALALALVLPAGSYLLCVPVLLAAGVGLVRLVARPGRSLDLSLWVVPTACTGALWLPVGLGLIDAVGLDLSVAIAVVLSVAALGALPGLARAPSRSGGLLVCAAFVVAAWLSALAVPAFDAHAPQRLSVSHLQNGDQATWCVDATWGPVPEPMRRAGGLTATHASPLPLMAFGRVTWGVAPPIEAPAPTLEPRGAWPADGGRRLSFRLRSPRGAPMAVMLVPPTARLRSVRLAGQPVTGMLLSRSPTWPDHTMVGVQTLPLAGVDVEIVVGGGATGRLVVVDVTGELPATLAPLLAARGAWGAPSQYGDLSLLVGGLAL